MVKEGVELIFDDKTISEERLGGANQDGVELAVDINGQMFSVGMGNRPLLQGISLRLERGVMRRILVRVRGRFAIRRGSDIVDFDDFLISRVDGMESLQDAILLERSKSFIQNRAEISKVDVLFKKLLEFLERARFVVKGRMGGKILP